MDDLVKWRATSIQRHRDANYEKSSVTRSCPHKKTSTHQSGALLHAQQSQATSSAHGIDVEARASVLYREVQFTVITEQADAHR